MDPPPEIQTEPQNPLDQLVDRTPKLAQASDPPLATSDDTDNNILAATVEFPPKSHGADVLTTKLKDPEVRDYGWNVPPNKVPAPIVHGLSNDDLYTLLRRFNKQVFHVKAIPQAPVGLLDLEYSQQEEFSPDKLRATLERLYMTVIVGVAAFAKHVARLRSWNEPRRTAGFCVAYYIAWLFNLIMPLLLSTFVLLILKPRARKYLFPPAPLAMVSATSGNLPEPKAGTLGSDDSLSGAPEQHQGEAVEQEARHFVSGFAAVAVSTAAGKGPGGDGNGNAVGGREAEAEGVDKQISSVDGSVPDPVGVVLSGVEAKDLAPGDTSAKDAAKKPVNDAMWNKARPIMQLVEDIADGWERWDNALSPTPPFSMHITCIRLAAPLIPLILITYFVKSAVFLRMFTFILGMAFFGQPILVRAAHWLTRNVPDWREYLELRRTLLIGVPTNAQLTLTLLRIAEAQKAPFPPPPTSLDAPTAHDPTSDSDTDLEVDVSNYSVDDAEHGTDTESCTSKSAVDDEKEIKDPASPKRTPGRKVAGFFKRAVRAGVGGALSIDHLKAAAGSENAKRRIGALSDSPLTDVKHPYFNTATGADTVNGYSRIDTELDKQTKPGPIENGEGPSVFSARMRGKRGYILVVNSATSPCVSFAHPKPYHDFKSYVIPNAQPQEMDAADIHPEFTMGLTDIVELRKVGGFGWKGKMVIGWALEREVVDGLEITDKEGKKVLLTAVRGRDELFNRLIAMGGHKWECW